MPIIILIITFLLTLWVEDYFLWEIWLALNTPRTLKDNPPRYCLLSGYRHFIPIVKNTPSIILQRINKRKRAK